MSAVFVAAAYGQDSFNLAGPYDHFDAAGDSSNVIVTAGTAASNYLLGTGVNLISGTVTVNLSASFGSEARIRLRNSEYPSDYADLRVFGFGLGIGGPYVDQLNTDDPNLTGPLVGKMIHTGSTWTVEFFDSFDDAADVADATSENIQFSLTAYTVPTPPTATDLGTLNNGLTTRTDAHNPGDILWYKINVPVGTTASNSAYLDVDTEGTTGYFGAFDTNDTEISVYNSIGVLLSTDDDEGTDFLSQISFGTGAGDRGTTFGGSNYDGRDGDVAAGIYYIAVSGFNMISSNGFNVTTDSDQTGDVVLNVNYSDGTGGGGSAVSGTVTLNNSDSDWSNESVTVEVVDPFSMVTVETHTTTLSATGAYSVPTALTFGNYDVYIKGDTFLRKLTSGVAFSASGASVNATLTNGDVDGDNEIAPNDFSILSGAFGNVDGDPGYNAAADLDDDGEVGPNDFSILAANFGQSGD